MAMVVMSVAGLEAGLRDGQGQALGAIAGDDHGTEKSFRGMSIQGVPGRQISARQ